MKRFLPLFVLFFCYFTLLPAQGIDTLFARVPRSVLPALDRTARLDLLDLYNGKLTARAENLYGGQVELTDKTADCIRLKTSDAGLWQMKVLTHGMDTLVVCVRTLLLPAASSKLSAYDAQWRTARTVLPRPRFEQFYLENDSLPLVRRQLLRSVLKELPIEAQWRTDEPVLVFRLSIEALSSEQQIDARSSVREVRYRWEAGRWELDEDVPSA